MELITLLAPVLAGAITALVAIWTWYRQRAVERGKQIAEQTTRYVTPLLFAAEDLQSRLFNIAKLNPMALLDDAADRRRFATETIYLVAQYFYYEALLLQYTPFGHDPNAVAAIQRVRKRFSEADGRPTRDAWCIFHPRQRAWGRAAADPAATVSEPAAISLLGFESALRAGELDPLAAQPILQSFDAPQGLDERSRQRLARVQAELAELLEHLESRLVRPPPWYRPLKRRRYTPLTLFAGRRRLRADEREARAPSTTATFPAVAITTWRHMAWDPPGSTRSVSRIGRRTSNC